MGILDRIFAGKAKDVVDSVGNAIDKIFTNKEEKAQAMLEIDKEINRHMEAMMTDATVQLELILADKQSAREMYKANSGLQKIYALSFLAAYIVLAFGTIYLLVDHNAKVPDNVQVLIASTFGGMSVKVSTITDFLFGSGMDSTKK